MKTPGGSRGVAGASPTAARALGTAPGPSRLPRLPRSRVVRGVLGRTLNLNVSLHEVACARCGSQQPAGAAGGRWQGPLPPHAPAAALAGTRGSLELSLAPPSARSKSRCTLCRGLYPSILPPISLGAIAAPPPQLALAARSPSDLGTWGYLVTC